MFNVLQYVNLLEGLIEFACALRRENPYSIRYSIMHVSELVCTIYLASYGKSTRTVILINGEIIKKREIKLGDEMR